MNLPNGKPWKHFKKMIPGLGEKYENEKDICTLFCGHYTTAPDYSGKFPYNYCLTAMIKIPNEITIRIVFFISIFAIVAL